MGKGLEIVLDFDPQLPATVLGDPGRLRQIVLNLVGNAIKFTETGEIVVRAAAASSGDQWLVHLEVCDTGIGIEPRSTGAYFRFVFAGG